MNDEQVFELAEKNGFQDDFGRWNFTDEELLDFVFMVQKAEREAGAKVTDHKCCTICQCGFTDDESGVRGYLGTLSVDFCDFCFSGLCDMIDQNNEDKWVGLSVNEARDFYEKYTNREELIYAIDKFLEEKNT